MRLFLQTIACLVVATASAIAMEKQFISEMQQSAKAIEQNAALVSQTLKAKKLNAEEVRQKIDSMESDVTKLQELVKQFEATNPKLSGKELADWQLLKEKVQLLEIFHEQKKKLASEDLLKNRSLIRAHAEGVAKRAQKLQDTASRLQRGSAS